MSLKQRLVDAGFSAENVPNGYQILGDVLLAKFPMAAKIKAKKELARAIADALPNVRAVCEIRRVKGEFRKPVVSLIFSKSGKTTETVHIEHGIKYRLDPRKIMFSKGNLAERARLASHIRPAETAVDMFAGIGYFSLGIARAEPTARIISIEKNPVAFKYLRQNITLNGIDNIKAIRGDCRRVRVKEKADRVLMGYFPGTEKFLPAAFKLLKPHGVVHYHNIYSEQDMNEKPLSELKQAAAKAGYKVISVAHHVVKSYAPRVSHVVVDAEVEKI